MLLSSPESIPEAVDVAVFDREERARPARRIRLLWLIDSLNMGGAESLVLPFIRRYDRTRYDLSLVCLTTISGNPIEREVFAESVPFLNVGARNLRDVAAFRRLRAFIRERRIDLVHAHLTYASIWGAVAARLEHVPIVASLHVAPPERRSAAGMRDFLLRNVLDRWSDRVIAVSGALRELYVAKGNLRAEKLVPVHNGIELARFERDRCETRARLLREFDLPDDALIAATVSVMRPKKGIEVLLAAAEQIVRDEPRAHFLLIGDGPLREEWAALASRGAVANHIRWAGFRRDVDELLAGCDLLVHPTLEDAFPTVLLEAMAARLPVVASRVGGVPEIVTPHVTGELVPANDPDALARAVTLLLRDTELRTRMGEAGHCVASVRFSTDAWIARLDGVYDGVLERAL